MFVFSTFLLNQALLHNLRCIHGDINHKCRQRLFAMNTEAAAAATKKNLNFPPLDLFQKHVRQGICRTFLRFFFCNCASLSALSSLMGVCLPLIHQRVFLFLLFLRISYQATQLWRRRRRRTNKRRAEKGPPPPPPSPLPSLPARGWKGIFKPLGLRFSRWQRQSFLFTKRRKIRRLILN